MGQRFSIPNAPSRLKAVIAITLLIIAGWFLLEIISHAETSFNRAVWINAKGSILSDDRFRMSADLLEKLREKEGVTFDFVLEHLGPPDSEGKEYGSIRYTLGRKYVGPIPLQGYYLKLSFDDEGKLVDTVVAPE